MEPKKKLYVILAQLIEARHACSLRDNDEWHLRHSERLKALAKEYLPSGSGWDSGTLIDLDVSNADRIVLTTHFHHMDENGSYSHWSSYRVTIKPSLAHGFTLRIVRIGKTPRDPSDFRDFAAQEFEHCLSAEIDPEPLYNRLDGIKCTGCGEYWPCSVERNRGQYCAKEHAKHAKGDKS